MKPTVIKVTLSYAAPTIPGAFAVPYRIEKLVGASYLLTADGTQEPIAPGDNRRTFKLEEMQKAVGGYIEVVSVYLDPNHLLIVDEEGLLKHLPLNHIATLLAGRAIVGPAMLIPVEAIE